MYSLASATEDFPPRVLWNGKPRVFTFVARVLRAHVHTVTFRFDGKRYFSDINDIHGLSWFVCQNALSGPGSSQKSRRQSVVYVHPLQRVGDAWSMTATLAENCIVVDAGDELPRNHLVQRGDLVKLVVELCDFTPSGLIPKVKRIDILAEPQHCCCR